MCAPSCTLAPPKKRGLIGPYITTDFRRVNSVTKKDAQPMPRIDDILDQLGGGARYFSTLDLASGFWQLPLREQDREKTAFSVGGDHYEFTVMPFGLTNASATFQRMMGNILKGVKGCLVFIDDIIVFSETPTDSRRGAQSYSCCRVESQTRQMSVCAGIGKVSWPHLHEESRGGA